MAENRCRTLNEHGNKDTFPLAVYNKKRTFVHHTYLLFG